MPMPELAGQAQQAGQVGQMEPVEQAGPQTGQVGQVARVELEHVNTTPGPAGGPKRGRADARMAVRASP